MPLPLDILRQAQRAPIEVWLDDAWHAIHPGPMPKHPALLPRLTVLSAAAPKGEELPESETQTRHQALGNALSQGGDLALPARIHWGEHIRPAYAVLALSRARAIKLAYKRKQWVVWRISPGGVEVVYTGLNSRAR